MKEYNYKIGDRVLYVVDPRWSSPGYTPKTEDLNAFIVKIENSDANYGIQIEYDITLRESKTKGRTKSWVGLKDIQIHPQSYREDRLNEILNTTDVPGKETIWQRMVSRHHRSGRVVVNVNETHIDHDIEFYRNEKLEKLLG